MSVSGLHVTAVVGATMLLVLRLLALSPWLALRWPLPVIAAGAAGVTAVGYTLLTGAEVPTVRSCIAALMVLAAMMLGRQAITLRLVAFGALVVLLLWPEALMGPSFQMSFAAVTAIVALYESQRVRGWFERREEGWGRRLARGIGSLLLTGLVVEIALTPIALYHFHKSGLYGALANIAAIPLTTFVVMPFEAAGLVFDAVGLGAPFWWVAEQGLRLLLWIAHTAANAPGALAMLPAMPGGAYAQMVAGGLWIALWRAWARLAGLIAVALGALWALATPMPDLLITGDGRHLALRMPGGELALLRDRAGGLCPRHAGREWRRGCRTARAGRTARRAVQCGPVHGHGDARRARVADCRDTQRL
ncbi:ComEC/Rec2 family competence protein [Sphingomonas sp. J344]|uniref:ComEC/Rec2 family competence protein n=1 Tax=Sphingomonas sp. J344 TaxID=2898434 RepID=UPI0027E2384D|nr:ComEC/Rec2 family competence protein [Sphingomonas sp. J344]